jgi:4-hydroxymandelate synthase
MCAHPRTTTASIGLAYVEFYVADAEAQAEWLVDQYACRIVARSRSSEADRRSVAVKQGDILLVLTEGCRDTHPASEYVQRHGDGVANIALTTPDVRSSFTEAVSRGALPVMEPVRIEGHTMAAIRAFGDVTHSFVELPPDAGDNWCPPGLSAVGDPGGEEVGLHRIDHFAVCVPAGQLETTTRFYESALGFRGIFEERIVVGTQAMNSRVVQSVSGELTFTVIEPDTSRDPGQIDEFLNQHEGAGVQHIAFSTSNVVRSVGALRDRGVRFLTTPSSYYTLLPQRINVSAYDLDELRNLDILVDDDHAGQLFQIFTRSTHPRRTFFFEVIERFGAQSFGSGNIKALYEAVESERLRTRDVVG